MSKFAGLVLITAGIGFAAYSGSSHRTPIDQETASQATSGQGPVSQKSAKQGSARQVIVELVRGRKLLRDSTNSLRTPSDEVASRTAVPVKPATVIAAKRKPRSFSAGKSLADRQSETVTPASVVADDQSNAKPVEDRQQLTSYLGRLLPWRSSPEPSVVKTIRKQQPDRIAPPTTTASSRHLPSGSTTLYVASSTQRNGTSERFDRSNPAGHVIAEQLIAAQFNAAQRQPDTVFRTVSTQPQAQVPALLTAADGDEIQNHDFADAKPDNETARLAVARELQRELRRVGCYTGVIDGTWGAESQHAMTAFTRRVNATLPVDEPDYILLTLVQGHFDKACSATTTATFQAETDAVDAADAVDAPDTDETDLPPLPVRVVRSNRRPDRLAVQSPRKLASVVTPALFKARRLARRNSIGTRAVVAELAPIPTRKPSRKSRTRPLPGRMAIRGPRKQDVNDLAQRIASRVSNNSAQVTINRNTQVARPNTPTTSTTRSAQPIPADWRSHKWAMLPRPSKRSLIQTPAITPNSTIALAAAEPSQAVRTPQRVATTPEPATEPSPPTSARDVAPVIDRKTLDEIDERAERAAADKEDAREERRAADKDDAREERRAAARQAAREERSAEKRAAAREQRAAAKSQRRARRKARSGRFKPKYSLGASNRRSARRRAKSRRKAKRRNWRRNFFANQSLNGN